MRSHERRAPVTSVLRKEVRELITGNSLWVLLLLLSPLVGYSFIQAVALYAETSRRGESGCVGLILCFSYHDPSPGLTAGVKLSRKSDRRCMRAGVESGGHDRSVDDTQALYAIDAQLRIDDGGRVGAHAAGAARMEVGRGAGADIRLDRRLVVGDRGGSKLCFDQRFAPAAQASGGMRMATMIELRGEESPGGFPLTAPVSWTVVGLSDYGSACIISS